MREARIIETEGISPIELRQRPPWTAPQRPTRGHKRWYAEPGACGKCVANAAAGDVPLDQPFPSGAMQPGAHNGCACKLLIDEQSPQYAGWPLFDDMMRDLGFVAEEPEDELEKHDDIE